MLTVEELQGFIINNEEIYRTKIDPIINNLAIKIVNKNYISERELTIWRRLANEGAKKYKEDIYKDNSVLWKILFSKEVREQVALNLKDYYQEVLYDRVSSTSKQKNKVLGN